MAVTITKKVSGATRVVQLAKGLKIAHVRATIGADTDYTVGTGFAALTPTALGLTVIWSIFGATLRSSNGNLKTVIPIFDYNTGYVRVFETAAGEAVSEIEQADIGADDVLDCIVLGV